MMLSQEYMEGQVCSFRQAQGLKQMGIIQLSSWCYQFNGTDKIFKLNTKIPRPTLKRTPRQYAAYTSGELGRLIPGRHLNMVWKMGEKWYIGGNMGETSITREFESEAQARAQLLINLLATGTLKSETINKLLK